MKYRKRPVVVEASQWFKNGDHPEDACTIRQGSGLTPDAPPAPHLSEGKVVRYYRRPGVRDGAPCEQCGKPHGVHGWIDTLEGGHRVCPGDFIITGVAGERYPCKSDIFDRTYEPVEGS